ncbi:MAG: glycosyltransferase family 9 protein [Planctomycetota bacterium]|nr:glycosyltransferase family 9 protein [Planctomycetota bacterium]
MIARPGETMTERERILVIRNRYIGDTVLAIPFLRNLRRRFPDAVIDVLVEPGAGQILADCPYKDELVVWQRPQRVNDVVPGSLANVITTARWLRRREYDRAYILKRSLSTGLLAWLAGIPHRVGVAKDGRGLLLTRRVSYHKERHEVESSLDLLRADGIEVDDGHNENWVPDELGAKIDRLLHGVTSPRRRVFVAPRSTDEKRNWPLDRMAETVRWLIEDRGCDVILCGSRADRSTHRRLVAALAPPSSRHLHDFSQECSLREAAALLSRMDLCLGVDSGLPHVAASFGVPVVTLSGAADPRQWHPWKTPSVVVESADGTRMMLGITVGQVQAAVDQLFAQTGIREEARRRGMRSLDLRSSAYPYQVVDSSSYEHPQSHVLPENAPLIPEKERAA